MTFLNRYFKTTRSAHGALVDVNINFMTLLRDFTFFVLALIMLFGSWYITPAGTQSVVTRAGSVDRQTSDGLHFKIPIVESVYDISTMANRVEIKNAEGGTSDLQPVHTALTVRYALTPKYAMHVFKHYSRDGDLDNYVQTATQEAFKAVTARYSASNLVQQRSRVSMEVVSTIQAKVQRFGVQIEAVDMTAFAYDKDYMRQISSKVQETEKYATEVKVLERIKIQEQQKVEKAKAEAEVTVAAAEAEAKALTLQAEAKAAAINAEGRALRENQNVAELRRIEVEMAKAQKWDGALPQHIYGSAPVPFMDVKK